MPATATQPALKLPDIVLQPKQLELLRLLQSSRATWLGYGGSRGGAKSHGGRNAILARAVTLPGTRWLVMRRTYDLVRENHIEPLLSQFPALHPYYRSGDKELRLPNKSVICFRYAENRGDVEAMIGKEYHGGLVDQAESFTEHELTVIKSCVRAPQLEASFCKLLLTFNPGGVGHKFLKRVFFDKKYHGNERADDYAFIQAYAWDNVGWSMSALQADGLTVRDYYNWDSDTRFNYFISRTQYGHDLNSQPPSLRLGWLLGHMDQFAGQYFDIFSPERHVKRCQPEAWHSRWIGIDWGFAHSSVAHWVSQVDTNRTVFYREFAGTGRSPRALAEEIGSRTPQAEREQVKHIFLSHDAFSKRTEQDTIADQMGSVFRHSGLPYPEVASTDVEGRASLLYSMMERDEISIDPSCVELIKAIPEVHHDPNRPKATLKFDGDDAFDSAVYALTYRMSAKAMPREQQIMNHAQSIPDLTNRWFYLQKQMHSKPSPVVRANVRLPWQMEGPRL